jgi:membrane-bound serine protease (ClpP class)
MRHCRPGGPSLAVAARAGFSLLLLLAGFALLATGRLRAQPAETASTGESGGVDTTATPEQENPPGRVYFIPVADAIGPVTARFIVDGIHEAEAGRAQAAVIELDTPGGLDLSMRQIVKAILGASVPVVVYVAPSGARAASAGVFITLAAPIAAMAPGTNIGAASPVGMGGGPAGADTTMTKKVTNDAVAYIRSLAERYGRNADWAEQAVRNGVSVPAEEALAKHVVDLIATSRTDLLEKIDGKTVRTVDGDRVLRTAGAERVETRMNWRERLLAILTNPSIAYLLFLGGIMGIALELYHPGAILPGVVGGISLILAFFALQQLPVNIAGILLILLAVVLFLLEIKVPSYGILSIGGVTSLVLGSLFLFRSGSAARVSLAVLIPAVLTVAAFFLLVVVLVTRAQLRRGLSGREGLVNEIGEAFTEIDPRGKVFIHGEYWNAHAGVPIPKGASIRVKSVRGLELEVEPLQPEV